MKTIKDALIHIRTTASQAAGTFPNAPAVGDLHDITRTAWRALDALEETETALEVMRDLIKATAAGNTEPDDLAAMAAAILADLDAGGDGSDTPDRYDARDNDEEERADALNL
jgi:hypothetical protein